MRLSILSFFILLSFCSHSQQECYLGKKHPLPKQPESVSNGHKLKLLEAFRSYAADSTNADSIIWLGRRMGYTGLYEPAIDVFTQGAALHPGDARMYRHRGHRYITLRCFDKAIADFERAAELIKGKGDEVEPDGIPNEKNIPTSTLQSNIWYHLGLAYFLNGEYAKAETAYRAGLAVSKNEDMYVAMANWLYITLLSQDKLEEAANLYATVDPDANLVENDDYMTLLYFYRHKPNIKEIERYTGVVIHRTVADSTSVSAATLYFGAGYYARLNGMPEKAKLFFERAVSTQQWASFGYIAAEAVLNRMKN